MKVMPQLVIVTRSSIPKGLARIPSANCNCMQVLLKACFPHFCQRNFVVMLTPDLVSSIATALQSLNSTRRVVFPISFSVDCKETLLIGTGTGFLFFVFGFLCRSLFAMLCFVKNSPTFGNPMTFYHRLGRIFNRSAKGIMHVIGADINA